MHLDLEIPDRLVRKIRALNILEGDRDPDQVEALIVATLEQTVEARIKSHLGDTISSGFSLPMPNLNQQHAKRMADEFEKKNDAALRGMLKDLKNPGRMETDESGMSDGLGDFEEDMPAGESDEEAFVPKKGGVSDKDIDNDMDVDDPEHEAKAEATAYPSSISPEQILSNVVGIPLPSPEDAPIDDRILRRKRKVKLKGRVTDATDSNLHDLL